MQNQTVLKLKEFYSECKTFSYRYKYRRWIDFYDIETVFKYMLIDSNISEFTSEIMIHLQLSIEKFQKSMKIKSTPFKAFKLLVDTAIKSVKNV
jgi:hypothetical protein